MKKQTVILPQTMQAAILVKQNQPLVVDEIQLPQTLDYGQVLVKLTYSGICGSQIGEIQGVKGPDKFLPHLLGHEGSGRVIAVGSGVQKVQRNDYVVLHWMKGSGIQASAPIYQWRNRQVNAGWVTTFNEYAIVSENRLTVIPDWIKPKIAPLFGCAVTTGLGVLTNKAKLLFGESIIVFGVGGVGLNIIQGAKLSSAYPIIAVDIYDHKLELAKKIGATHTINSTKTNSRNAIAAILKEGADVSVDCTGIPEVIQRAYALCKSNGRTILVGVPQKDHNISIFSLPLHFGKIITGTHGGETNPDTDIPRYVNLVKNGLLHLDPLITDEFRLEDINTVIQKMKSGQISGRSLISYEK